jgi:hypothetical protein
MLRYFENYFANIIVGQKYWREVDSKYCNFFKKSNHKNAFFRQNVTEKRAVYNTDPTYSFFSLCPV